MSFFARHWFLIALALLLGVGLTRGTDLGPWVDRIPRDAIVAGVMFLMALPMQFGELTTALRRYRASSLALTLNVVIAPLLAWGISYLLPPSLALGLMITAAVPCTLASAAVWTRRGGGNDAIALLVTLITNLACFLVLPFWIGLYRGESLDLGAGMGSKLSRDLLLLVVLPVVVAQALRLYYPIARSASLHKLAFSMAAQVGLLAMVFIGACEAGKRLDLLEPSTSGIGPLDWATMLLAVLVIHLVLFALGWWGGAGLGIGAADRLAVAISGSQKTLMVGVYVALQTDDGLAALPLVAYHVTQLLVDTVLVDRLRPQIVAATT
jgi:solute carrier family 10 (sodium/bile acid cotransporter), member 7